MGRLGILASNDPSTWIRNIQALSLPELETSNVPPSFDKAIPFRTRDAGVDHGMLTGVGIDGRQLLCFCFGDIDETIAG